MTARCRPVVLLVVLVVLAGVLAGVARAGSQVDATVQALRSAPLYSAPKAELGLSSAEQSRVERAIAQDEPGPMYIAVLPDRARAETGGDTTELVRAIAESAYKRGARFVDVHWFDPWVKRARIAQAVAHDAAGRSGPAADHRHRVMVSLIAVNEWLRP